VQLAASKSFNLNESASHDKTRHGTPRSSAKARDRKMSAAGGEVKQDGPIHLSIKHATVKQQVTVR